jgi:hypothetical protein
MRIAFEALHAFRKRPGRINFEQFKLAFGRARAKPPPMTKEQAAAQAKAVWLGRMQTAGKKVDKK